MEQPASKPGLVREAAAAAPTISGASRYVGTGRVGRAKPGGSGGRWDAADRADAVGRPKPADGRNPRGAGARPLLGTVLMEQNEGWLLQPRYPRRSACRRRRSRRCGAARAADLLGDAGLARHPASRRADPPTLPRAGEPAAHRSKSASNFLTSGRVWIGMQSWAPAGLGYHCRLMRATSSEAPGRSGSFFW